MTRILSLFLILLAFGIVGRMDYEEARRIEAEMSNNWTRKCVLDVQAHYLTCRYYDSTGRLRVTHDML